MPTVGIRETNDMRARRQKPFDQVAVGNGAPRLYVELASWWPLLSAPAEYAEEAAFYERTLVAACERPARTLLELGSGGGNNASHLKAQFQMSFQIDLSSQPSDAEDFQSKVLR